MKKNFLSILFIFVILGISLFISIPWSKLWITLPMQSDYKFWLDLQGWVELDYKVDLDEAKTKRPDLNSKEATEWIKSIIEKRVNSLGTAEPTIFESSYGNESHVVVQIPTTNFEWQNLSKEEIRLKNQEYIEKAKEVIWKVVRLEFKEKKTKVTDADKAERKKIADEVLAEAKEAKFSFSTIGNKFKDKYENVTYVSSTGTLSTIPSEFKFKWIETATWKYLSQVFDSSRDTYEVVDWSLQSAKDNWYSIVSVSAVKEELIWTGSKKEKVYTYDWIYISKKPSEWTSAKTADWKALDERYLLRSNVSFNQTYAPQVDLVFNDEWAKIFAELTKRLIGKQLAIYVGWELLTAPTVQAVIPDWKAVITGNYTVDSAKKLSNDINTWIVPAPIYLTSERVIDAKVGNDSLGLIINAWLIWFGIILVFMVSFYWISWLMAMVALAIYTFIVLALVKIFGIVLTLASIAWIVLSVWMAIDANILIFERTKEELRNGNSLLKSITVWFVHSWSAIRDSHITSFVSAVILFIFWVSLIKWFWVMLGIWIIVSLFSAMYISRVLIITLAPKFDKNLKLFIGFKK